MYNTNERGTRNPNAQATHGQGTTTAGATGQAGLAYGQSAASGPAPTTAGLHRHDVLNKLDPRVDSTQDHQPMSQTSSSIPEGTYGPHHTRIANTLDPRVDSDLDSTRAGAPAATGAGARGGVPEGTYGPHPSRLANTLDPRVDSDRDRHAEPGGTRAPMTGPTTATGTGHGGVSAAHASGPHRSDLLNKLDPRVDSKTGTWKGGSESRGTY